MMNYFVENSRTYLKEHEVTSADVFCPESVMQKMAK